MDVDLCSSLRSLPPKLAIVAEVVNVSAILVVYALRLDLWNGLTGRCFAIGEVEIGLNVLTRSIRKRVD